jgi:hypothetical protein
MLFTGYFFQEESATYLLDGLSTAWLTEMESSIFL